jgi:hypothetical protein
MTIKLNDPGRFLPVEGIVIEPLHATVILRIQNSK